MISKMVAIGGDCVSWPTFMAVLLWVCMWVEPSFCVFYLEVLGFGFDL